MANEARVRQNFLGGLIEDNPLAIGATTLTSAALAAVVAIASTQHMPITLDPDGLYGEPEIAWITAHTLSATTATILRGQEGTTARAHLRDVPWTHGPTVLDFDGAWTAYTPLWGTTGGTAPVIGNGTLTGFYRLDGKTLRFRIKQVMGSTTTYGTGDWTWTIPSFLTAKDDQTGITAAGEPANVYRHGTGRIYSATPTVVVYPEGIANRWNATTPNTWASGNALYINGTIEVA